MHHPSGDKGVSGDVVDVVLVQVGCVPGDSAVVGIVVEDSQAVVRGSGCDDKVYCRGTAVLPGRAIRCCTALIQRPAFFGTAASG